MPSQPYSSSTNEVLPERGIGVAQVGQTLQEITEVAGSPSTTDHGSAYWHEASHEPAFVAHFGADGLVELIELYHGEEGRPQATLRGIQLTNRPMDEVAADLERAGYHATKMDIGYEYDEGFCIWSMASRSAGELTGYDPTDDRLIVEGVSVAPIGYWR